MEFTESKACLVGNKENKEKVEVGKEGLHFIRNTGANMFMVIFHSKTLKL